MTTYNALETMKTIRFGLELELTGLNRDAAANTVRSIVGGTIRHMPFPSCYDRRIVTAPDGREWTVMRDGSLDSMGFEVVSPICNYDDIETIQAIVRALKAAGARCTRPGTEYGMHIHLDGAAFTNAQIVKLTKLAHQQEDLILDAFGVRRRAEQGRWCRKMNQEIINRLPSNGADHELARAWYDTDDHGSLARQHYHGSRYRGINLHSLFYRRATTSGRGTVEFRWWAATTHAGKVKAAIQFALALGAKAIHTRATRATKREYNAAHSNYAWRVFLIRLGLNGDEFSTLRTITRKYGNLQGSTSYANGSADASTSPRRNRAATAPSSENTPAAAE